MSLRSVTHAFAWLSRACLAGLAGVAILNAQESSRGGTVSAGRLRLVVAGDVTWASAAAGYFNPQRLELLSRPVVGLAGADWDRVVAELKAADVVVLQFDPTAAGARKEGQPDPDWHGRKVIAAVKAKGARPILLGPTVAPRRTDGRVDRDPAGFVT